MLKTALETIKQYHMLDQNDAIVMGISGGADSTALLHLLVQLRAEYSLRLFAVHINHGIRGDEAKGDADFVVDLCKNLQVPCKVFEFDVLQEAKKLGISVEEAGRHIRYSCFREVGESLGGAKIAVAHNLNDQAETLIMRFCRGTGLKGLSGIAPNKNGIIRPLIQCKRADIEKYLEEQQVSFRTDHTNNQEIYTRNKIRLRLIPWLQNEINSSSAENIGKTAFLLAEDEDYMENHAQCAYNNVVLQSGENEVILDMEKLKCFEKAIIRRVLRIAFRNVQSDIKDLAYGHIEDIIGLFENGTGKKLSLPFGIQAETSYNKLKLYKFLGDKNVGFFYNIVPGETMFIKEVGKNIELSLNEEKKNILGSCICTKAFDYDKIKNSVVIRTRKSGDRISLKGSFGTKKLKDLFIDEKIPRTMRDSMMLVADGDRIIWIVDEAMGIGGRLSGAFDIGKDTKNILFIHVWEDV